MIKDYGTGLTSGAAGVGDGVIGGPSLGSSKGGLIPSTGASGVESVSVCVPVVPPAGGGVGAGSLFLTSSSSEVTFW